MKIHIVKKGDTLFQLAQKYHVDLDKLIEANPQIADPNQIDVGMKVKIPSHPVVVAPPSEQHMQKHIVKQGDTLWKLSKSFGVPLDVLIAANPQLKNPSVLLTGEVVNIPAQDSAPMVPVQQTGHSIPGKVSTAPIVNLPIEPEPITENVEVVEVENEFIVEPVVEEHKEIHLEKNITFNHLEFPIAGVPIKTEAMKEMPKYEPKAVPLPQPVDDNVVEPFAQFKVPAVKAGEFTSPSLMSQPLMPIHEPAAFSTPQYLPNQAMPAESIENLAPFNPCIGPEVMQPFPVAPMMEMGMPCNPCGHIAPWGMGMPNYQPFGPVMPWEMGMPHHPCGCGSHMGMSEMPHGWGMPATANMPITANMPMTSNMPATANMPAMANMPATANMPAMANMPATANMPAMANMPATANMPMTSNMPAVMPSMLGMPNSPISPIASAPMGDCGCGQSPYMGFFPNMPMGSMAPMGMSAAPFPMVNPMMQSDCDCDCHKTPYVHGHNHVQSFDYMDEQVKQQVVFRDDEEEVDEEETRSESKTKNSKSKVNKKSASSRGNVSSGRRKQSNPYVDRIDDDANRPWLGI